jgi:hypothetical protein
MTGMVSNRFKLVTIALSTAALALAACGGGDNSNAASPEDERAEFREAALDFAECMREHGVDMEDPKPGSGGIQLIAPEGGDTAAMEKAQEACQKHLETARPPELSAEEQSEFRERALAHARCMREHGIDMPDPTFGEDGRVEMRMPSGARDDPGFEEAAEECADGLGMPGRLEQR